jgi:hypothetical protein
MKNKKLMYVLPGLMLLVGVSLFANFAKADNENEHSNKMFGSVMPLFKAEFKNDREDAKLNGTTLEVHISDNGTVLVRGAKVTGVSGNTVSASTTWGTMAMNWTVNVTSSTSFVRRNGSANMMSEISVGDIVSFTGPMTAGSNSAFSVEAKVLKDWSIQKQNFRSSIEGSIKSMSGNTLPASLVVTAGNGKDYTVSVPASASILSSSWVAVPYSSFAVNQKVAVYGLVNDSNLTVSATVLRMR